MGQYVEQIPSLVAVACFLSGRAKDLSAPLLSRMYGVFMAVCVLVCDTVNSVDDAPADALMAGPPKVHGIKIFWGVFVTKFLFFFLTKGSILNFYYEIWD